MAEEARDPGHDVPTAVNLVLFAVLGVYLGISVSRSRRCRSCTTRSAQPRPRRCFKRPDTPPPGRRSRTTRCSGSSRASACTARCCTSPQYYVGLLAATILFIATNAGLIGISRLSWSLAEHRQLPSIFSRLHPTLPHALVHDRLLLRSRRPADPFGEHQRARQPLLVRGDALVHDRRTPRSSRCASRTPTASVPTGCRGTCASAGARSRSRR